MMDGRLNTPWCDMRAGCMPPYLHAVATNFRSPCRRPVTVFVRSVIGRRREQERAPRQSCISPQHSHAKSALCGACSVGDRPILHGATCALAARHRIRRSGHVLPKPAPPTCRGVGAVYPQPSAWGSAPRVGPQHNHAKSALRGTLSAGGRPILYGAICARAARCLRGHKTTGAGVVTSINYRQVPSYVVRPRAFEHPLPGPAPSPQSSPAVVVVVEVPDVVHAVSEPTNVDRT